ncbi:uncharacterized protein [Mytilus edulis]|uniref:uncharacterized protein n=1 Tax=Mytilus edulis TaxID=6550 RepID=UPI0039F11A8B
MMPLLIGGDGLSVKRGEGAQRARADGISQEDRLEGFIWKSEDWHAHVISLQETCLKELPHQKREHYFSYETFFNTEVLSLRLLTDLSVPDEETDLDQQSTSNQSEEQQEKPDYKFNYSCCLLRECLQDWIREDSSKENDGDRPVRMWRFDFLRFWPFVYKCN